MQLQLCHKEYWTKIRVYICTFFLRVRSCLWVFYAYSSRGLNSEGYLSWQRLLWHKISVYGRPQGVSPFWAWTLWYHEYLYLWYHRFRAQNGLNLCAKAPRLLMSDYCEGTVTNYMLSILGDQIKVSRLQCATLGLTGSFL